eukprot:CAMPEP_0119335320 /NCGR_PEP_ID=MMETSP1333-20130426/89338_1 /TAXON_ID=418940 /ORGANISM="Scyphosphaera apsteinii, Strain RCC1455" /LENGTH=68 /DNA_ID=CAMNT_0007345841 /DNA_START=79 /DNA_END=281 /DNA_ORIENTATION=+
MPERRHMIASDIALGCPTTQHQHVAIASKLPTLSTRVRTPQTMVTRIRTSIHTSITTHNLAQLGLDAA